MLQLMNSRALSGLFMIILILAAFGLVLTDWTGSFRSGVGSTNVAEVAGEKITQNEFAGLVSRSLNGQQMTPQQAYQMGLVNRILISEMWQRLLAHESRQVGIAIDEATVLAHLRDMVAPVAATTKESPSVVLSRFIQSQGLTEGAFIAQIKRELGNNILRDTVQSAGPVTSTPMVNALLTARQQQRDIRFLFLADDRLPAKTPTDAELETYYEAEKNNDLSPETRSFTVTTLTAAQMQKNVTVTDDEVRAAYEERKGDLQRPETRAVSLAVYKDKAKAQKLADALKSGTAMNAATKKIGKPDTQTNDPVARGALPPELDQAVFAGKDNAVIGPISTPLGFYVGQLGALTPAGTQSFDQAKSDLKRALMDEKLDAAKSQILETLEQAINNGDDLATMAQAQNMSTETFANLSRDSANQKLGGARHTIVTTAFTGTETGHTLPPVELQNGDIVLVRVDSLVPAAPKPLGTIRADLIAQWQRETRARDNLMAAQGVFADVVSGKITLDQAAMTLKSNVHDVKGTRRDRADLPQGFDRAIWNRLFTVQKNKPIFETGTGGLVIAVVTGVTLPKPDDLPAMKEARADVIGTLKTAQTDETFAQFMGALNDQYESRVNDRLLKQMYGAKATAE